MTKKPEPWTKEKIRQYAETMEKRSKCTEKYLIGSN